MRGASAGYCLIRASIPRATRPTRRPTRFAVRLLLKRGTFCAALRSPTTTSRTRQCIAKCRAARQEFQWVNLHTWLHISVDDGKGGKCGLAGARRASSAGWWGGVRRRTSHRDMSLATERAITRGDQMDGTICPSAGAAVGCAKQRSRSSQDHRRSSAAMVRAPTVVPSVPSPSRQPRRRIFRCITRPARRGGNGAPAGREGRRHGDTPALRWIVGVAGRFLRRHVR